MSQEQSNALSAAPQEYLNAALWNACVERDIEKIGSLIVQGANPHAKMGGGLNMPILHWAAQMGHTEVCLALLDTGADLEFRRDPEQVGWTAFFYAAANNQLETCLALIERGANVNVLDGNLTSPLIWISNSEKLEIGKVLIANGADVNAVNKFGDTALHGAAMSATRDMTVLLLESGADATRCNINGESVLNIAESWSRDDQCQIIKAWLARTAALEAIADIKLEFSP